MSFCPMYPSDTYSSRREQVDNAPTDLRHFETKKMYLLLQYLVNCYYNND